MARRHSAAALPSSPRLRLLPDPSRGRSDVAPHQSRGPEPRQRDGSVCTYQQREAQLIPSCAHPGYTGALLGILLPPGQRQPGFWLKVPRERRLGVGGLGNKEGKSRTERYKVQQAPLCLPFVSHRIHFYTGVPLTPRARTDVLPKAMKL